MEMEKLYTEETEVKEEKEVKEEAVQPYPAKRRTQIRLLRSSLRDSMMTFIGFTSLVILIIYTALVVFLSRASVNSFVQYDTVKVKIIDTSVDIPDDADDSPSNGSKFMTRVKYNGEIYFINDYDTYNYARMHKGETISRGIKITYHRKTRPSIEFLEERGLNGEPN